MKSNDLSTSRPWDRVPGETDTAYHRFSIYMELRAMRSGLEIHEDEIDRFIEKHHPESLAS